MSVEELTKYLEDNKERVKDAVFAKIIDSLTRQVEWSLPKLPKTKKPLVKFH